MRAIPGVIVMVLGMLMIVARSVFGAGSGAVRTVLTGKPSTDKERKSDSFLPLVLGIGLVVAGFWLAVYALVRH